MEHIREVTESGFRIRLDLTEQVLRLGIQEDLFSGRVELHPTLPHSASAFLSAAALAQKAKQFDDGLYAAVELAAQNGAGNFAGKVFLLTTLASRLAEDAGARAALIMIGAAAKLGGLNLSLPPALIGAVEQATAGFLANELRAKPIAFYTWSGALESIFRQDRMLQTRIVDRGALAALIRVLGSDDKLRNVYVRYLDLIARLTNPFVGADLRSHLNGDSPPDEASVFPPSRSHETDLVTKLYGSRGVPEGFNLMDELVARIQRGDLPLQPTIQSGWYDYQIWSIEPLAIPEKMPEGPRLRLNEEYRKHLVDLFKGIYALTRETHAKQLHASAPIAPWGGPEPEKTIEIKPELSAEPLATFYLRRALSYRFIREVLQTAFGADTLKSVHRLKPAGATKMTLAEELEFMETLFYGAHATVSRQLGMDADTSVDLGSGKGPRAADEMMEQWRADLRVDEDVAQDARMMVPVFHDFAGNQTKVWIFLGWQEKDLFVSFATPPRILAAQRRRWLRLPEREPKIEFVSAYHPLATPVMAEVYVTRILNRDEFRRHCDRYETDAEILANLE